MAITYYDLYCDESGIDTGPRFHLGAIRCTPARAAILRKEFAAVRQAYGLKAEMKWTRVSNAMLPAYKAFVDVFLECPFNNARFYLLDVVRGPQWRAFGRSEDERFFKTYYTFVCGSLYKSDRFRYSAYVDDKPGKRYRWTNVLWSVNGAIRRNYGFKKDLLAGLTPMDSKECDLIQAVDVILGALVSTAQASAKQELGQYVRAKLLRSSDKLHQRSWSPVLPAKPRN